MTALLILVVCLTSAPDVCRDEPLPTDVNFGQCMTFGQQAAQEWLDEHPKWALKGWKCQVGHRPGNA